MFYEYVICYNYNLNLIAHFLKKKLSRSFPVGEFVLENISNPPKQCGSGLKFCLNSSAYFFNFQCVPDRRAGDATEWQGHFRGSTAGVRLEREAHVEQMVHLWFPYEDQLGHPGTQRTVVRAACLHSCSCLSGEVSFCLCCREVEGALNKFSRRSIRSLELWCSWGIFHTTILWRLCCDYSMSWPRCLFAGCWQ